MFYIKCGKECLMLWNQRKRTSKKLNLGNCKENSGDEIFRILSEMSKQRREIIDSMPQKKFFMSQKEIEQRRMSM